MASPTINRSIINSELYDKVHSIWFNGQPEDTNLPSEKASQRWFKAPDKAASVAFDEELSTAFLPALQSLYPEHFALPPDPKTHADELSQTSMVLDPFLPDLTTSDAGASAFNALALTILLDQITRNTHRSSQALIYTHFDRLSRALVRHAFSADLHAHPSIKPYFVKRFWLLMPLMHSEHLEDHEAFDQGLVALRKDGVECWGEEDEQRKGMLDQMVDFEQRHVAILKQFGRYPYRNEAIGRQSTEEEKKWLEEGGERFTS